MLSKREYGEWSLQEHKDREYQSDDERRFFGAIDNPKAPTPELINMVNTYGRFAKDKT
jgi:hypothetical protein